MQYKLITVIISLTSHFSFLQSFQSRSTVSSAVPNWFKSLNISNRLEKLRLSQIRFIPLHNSRCTSVLLLILRHHQQCRIQNCNNSDFILSSKKTYPPLKYSSIQCQIRKQSHVDYLLKLVLPTRAELEVHPRKATQPWRTLWLHLKTLLKSMWSMQRLQCPVSWVWFFI